MSKPWFSRRKVKSWVDHPGKVALIGAFLVLLGQFAATVFPIWFGPDISDYSLECNPIHIDILPPEPINTSILTPNIFENSTFYSVRVSVISLHPIQKYTRQVYVTVFAPTGFNAIINDPIIYAGQSTNVLIIAYKNELDRQIYPIVVQGLGADGKERNCTIIVNNQKESLEYRFKEVSNIIENEMKKRQ